MSQLQAIKAQIKAYATQYHRSPEEIRLLAVTKNRYLADIEALLKDGHRLFGENKVQEARKKWAPLKIVYPDVCLHLIGHLQTNKVKEAIELFDVIETLDSLKLADKLTKEESKQQKKLLYYVEVNIGKEPQKNGVFPNELNSFLMNLKKNYTLNIQGIMCIPPHNKSPDSFFKEMQLIANEQKLTVISMGMSEDYRAAIEFGSTLVRIGRALFEDM